jgi:hypothetical protein
MTEGNGDPAAAAMEQLAHENARLQQELANLRGDTTTLAQQTAQRIATLEQHLAALPDRNRPGGGDRGGGTKPAKPPKFSGKGSPVINEWLFALERLCEGEPDDVKVKVAS